MKNHELFVSIKFTIIIVLICILTLTTQLQSLGRFTFKGYKHYLPENPSVKMHITGMIDGFERGANDLIFAKGFFIEIYGLIKKITKSKVVEDANPELTVYKMDNGQLTYNFPVNDVNDLAFKTSEFLKHIELLGIPAFYIQSPFKIDKYENKLPYSIEDTTNKNADKFLLLLDKEDIGFIDTRELLRYNKKIVYDDLFFKTDHHWKPIGALKVASMVNDVLSKELEIKSEIQQKSFLEEKSSRGFIGSQGRRVGSLYSGIEEFFFVLPQFDTFYNISITNDQDEIYKEGTFREVFIVDDYTKSNDKYSNLYASYFGGDNSLVRIKNMKNEDGKLIIFSDSFGLTFNSILSTAYAELVIVDLRLYKSDEHITQFIMDENKIRKVDSVLIMYNPSMYREQNFRMFEF